MREDTISRQAAIDALDGEIEIVGKANAKAVLKYTQMVSDRIKALQPARPYLKADYIEAGKMPEPRWIPVTERLPEEAGEYLVTVINLVAETKSELIDIALWNDKIEENRGFLKADEVTAWMPLPKPYERSEEKTEKEENEA